MRYFRVEVNFLAPSKKDVGAALCSFKEKRDVDAKGSWLTRKTGMATGPNHTNMIAYKLVSPLVDINEIDVLMKLLTSLHENAGCIIDGEHPIKIHFLGKYRNGLARRIVYVMVSENDFMYTLLMYREHFAKLDSPSFTAQPLEDNELFVPYNVYFNIIKNHAVRIIVEELIAEIILKKARP